MKIRSIRVTPLRLPYKEPYHWAQGVFEAADVVLVAVESDAGLIGYGESVAPPSGSLIAAVMNTVTPELIGQFFFDIARIRSYCCQSQFKALGGDTPRIANRIFTGLELALWDLVGKTTEQPVHRLLGGAVRERIGYFAFLQGDTSDELAEDAREAVAKDTPVIYLKVGRGEETDLRNTAAVREVIGDRRLRLDGNEAWDPLTAIRMIRLLAQFDPEFIEQPTASHSLEALAHVKASVGVPIAADQCVYTPGEVYEVCRRRAADVIVLGLHEPGGVTEMKKAASVAEAAGLNVCIHGVFESGITTCAANQVAATIPNLDDGNQIMWQLLAQDIVKSPSLRLENGTLPVNTEPGLGFVLDNDAVAEGAQRFQAETRTRP